MFYVCRISFRKLASRSMESISLFLMMAVYILAGLNHFRVPRFYTAMIPPWLPKPYQMVLVSGACEILLGALLYWNQTRSFAAWSIIGMLVIFFIVHFHMYNERNGKFKKVPAAALLIRIPFQFVLIYWAYTFT